MDGMDDRNLSSLHAILARNVRRYRLIRSWSVEDVASRSHLKDALIARIEQALEPQVRLGVLECLARALGVTVSALLRGSARGTAQQVRPLSRATTGGGKGRRQEP
jgi:transcriptional regulator with XRE-family HTH domain